MTEMYGYDKTPTPAIDYDVSKVPPEIKKRTTWVKTKYTGEDVAEAYGQVGDIAGIYAGEAKQLAERTQIRQDAVEDFNTQVIQEMTDKDVISAPEIIESRDGEVKLSARLARDFGTLNSQVVETKNLVNMYVSPDNFDTLDACIDYARANKLIIKAREIVLDKQTSFRGVGLEIDKLVVSSSKSVELGDYNVDIHSTPSGSRVARPPQTIGAIEGAGAGWANEVFIRGACYQRIQIGHYNGVVHLRVNDFSVDEVNYPSTFIAYSEFHFLNVREVRLEDDDGVGLTDKIRWINENVFHLGNTLHFSIGNVGGYRHNTNRIYGGTFEGNSTINLINASDNHFYDIRAEGNLNITCSATSQYNTIELIHRTYLPSVNDLNGTNVIKGIEDDNALLVHYAELYNNDAIGGNESGWLSEIPLPFKNLTFDTTSRRYKHRARETGAGNHIYYVSPYLDFPRTMRAVVETSLFNGGVGYGYKCYDENYNDITPLVSGENFTPLMNTSHSSVTGKIQTGAYQGPSTGSNVYNNGTNIGNVIHVQSSGHWDSLANYTQAKEIRYIKLFVGGLSDGLDCEFRQMRIRVYDLSYNYHRRGLKNFPVA